MKVGEVKVRQIEEIADVERAQLSRQVDETGLKIFGGEVKVEDITESGEKTRSSGDAVEPRK